MNYVAERALALLRSGTADPDASFRPGQQEAIRQLLESRRRLLLVQKTGWGKSFVYFIAAKLLREGGGGPALLISPLLSLMRNQLAAAERMGVEAATIHSENQQEWPGIESRLERDEIDILLISPERLSNERFANQVLGRIASQLSLLVVDEAHCISDWGHDFRPHYRRIERIVRSLPANIAILATTATANERVMEDLMGVLGPALDVSRGDLARPSLTLQTLRLANQAERLAWLAEHLPAMPGSGIVYTLTVRDANLVANWLRSRGFEAAAYSSESSDREKLEQGLMTNQYKALVATTALGMGFDKPDLGFVVHYQAPGSVVAYYQQVGRAGRALDAAYGVLLSGEEDLRITDHFIESAFPSQEEVRQILAALEDTKEGLSVPRLLREVNVTRGRIEKALDLLALESPAPVTKVGTQWQLTAAPLSQAFWERAERLTALRRLEQQQVQTYVSLETGHMEFLIRALDGDPTGVEPPRLPPLPAVVSPLLRQEALSFLRRTSLPIKARKVWPADGLPKFKVTGRIPAELQAQEGRALCLWGDAGWGEQVRSGKYGEGRFGDELVQAAATLIREWAPQPTPTWLTCIPSLRHPDLVRDFSMRLAGVLDLPFEAVLALTGLRPEQKTRANSTQQALNLDGAMTLAEEPLPAGPVLLVDDLVDSGWTLTVAAWLLRRAGSAEVWPLVLARAGGRE